MKKIKILTIILIIVLITMVSFLGVYVQYQNRMEDKVKGYSYAMDLKGARKIKLKVSEDTREVIRDANGKEVDNAEDLTDEQLQDKGYTKQNEAYNNQDILNVENYKKTKELIEKRLDKSGVQNYEISLDEENGEIVIQVPENGATDKIVSNINTVGNFEILDSETKEILMDNNDIKMANVMYGQDSTSTTGGTAVYLNIEFTKEGAKKLEEISSTYIKEEEIDEESEENQTEDTESTENEEETKEKQITMKIDDETIMTTSFDEPIKIGKLQLSIGKSTTDVDTLNGYIEQASSVAQVLDTGKLPIKYNIEENKYIMSDITNKELQYIEIGFAIVALIGIIVLMFRYKVNGILAAISYVGLASIYLLAIRYTNVVLSIQGIFGIGIVLVLNYIFVNKILAGIKNKKELTKDEIDGEISKTYKEFFIKIIPICIATIVFCFIEWETISSFGMVMFWGITLIALYNFVITNTMLKIKADK